MAVGRIPSGAANRQAGRDGHGGVRGGEGEARPRAAADLSLPWTADQNGAADGAGRRGGGADSAGRRGGCPDEQGGAVDEQMRRLWIGKGATER